MPGKGDVSALESTGIEHERLANQHLLRRRSEHLYGAGKLLFLTDLVGRNAGSHCRCPEKVVSTPMPRRALDGGILSSLSSLLRKLGQGIVLSQNGDYRRARARGGDKSGRKSDAALYLKTLLGQKISQERRRLFLLQRRFGVFPDLTR